MNPVLSPPTASSNGVAPVAPVAPAPASPVVFGDSQTGSEGGAFLYGILAIVFSGVVYALLVPLPKGGSTGGALVAVLLHPSQEARVVVAILVLIAAYTLFSVRGNAARLGAESRLLSDIRDSLPGVLAGQTESFLQTKLKDAGRNTLLVQAVQSVWDARHMATPDLEAISASLAGLEEKRMGAGAGVGNRLMLLSLLGTILGLAQVISTLDPQIKSASATGDVDAIFANLNNTLMQMGTAFSSTAWGILLSTVVAWAVATASAARQDYVARVQHFVVAELAPRVIATSAGAAIENLNRAVVSGQQLLRDVNDTVSKASAAQSQMATHLVTAHQTLQAGTQAFVQKVEKVLTENAAQFAQNLQKVGDTVVAGAQAQSDAATQLDSLLRESTADMADAASSLRGAANVVAGLDVSVGRVDAATKQMTSDLATIAPQLQNLFATQVLTLTQVGKQQAIDLASFGTTQTKTADDRMARQETAFAQALANLKGELTQSVAQVESLVSAVQPRLPSAAELDKLRAAMDGVTRAADAIAQSGGLPISGGGSSVTPTQFRQAMSEALEPLRQQLQTTGASSSVGAPDNSQLVNQLAQTNQQVYLLAQQVHDLVAQLQAGALAPSEPTPYPVPTGVPDPYPPAPSYPAMPQQTWTTPQPIAPPTLWERFLKLFGRRR